LSRPPGPPRAPTPPRASLPAKPSPPRGLAGSSRRVRSPRCCDETTSLVQPCRSRLGAVQPRARRAVTRPRSARRQLAELQAGRAPAHKAAPAQPRPGPVSRVSPERPSDGHETKRPHVCIGGSHPNLQLGLRAGRRPPRAGPAQGRGTMRRVGLQILSSFAAGETAASFGRSCGSTGHRRLGSPGARTTCGAPDVPTAVADTRWPAAALATPRRRRPRLAQAPGRAGLSVIPTRSGPRYVPSKATWKIGPSLPTATEQITFGGARRRPDYPAALRGSPRAGRLRPLRPRVADRGAPSNSTCPSRRGAVGWWRPEFVLSAYIRWSATNRASLVVVASDGIHTAP
jgi:hypothetical protein